MPILDGFAATRKIRELESNGTIHGRLPIIALTANVSCENEDNCRNAGMDSFLAKPLKLQGMSAPATWMKIACSSVLVRSQRCRGEIILSVLGLVVFHLMTLRPSIISISLSYRTELLPVLFTSLMFSCITLFSLPSLCTSIYLYSISTFTFFIPLSHLSSSSSSLLLPFQTHFSRELILPHFIIFHGLGHMASVL